MQGWATTRRKILDLCIVDFIFVLQHTKLDVEEIPFIGEPTRLKNANMICKMTKAVWRQKNGNMLHREPCECPARAQKAAVWVSTPGGV